MRVLVVVSWLAMVASTACGSPAGSSGAASESSSAPVTAPVCDLMRSGLTFDAPNAEGKHVHGACDACLQASCCDAAMTCFDANADGECATLGACLDGCAAAAAAAEDPKAIFLCRDGCRAAHHSAEAAFDDYVACRARSCSAACDKPAP